MQGRSTS
jgi:hypothetical protein